MATKDTVVQELVVNTLTHKQFKAAQEAGTLSPYELYGTPDTSVRLPVLTPTWFDHLANDVSWLRADSFSWHSGDVYVAAYEHLAEDLQGATEQAETIGDITISYYQAEDGHKICVTDQESKLSDLFYKTGVAWYYIVDTENKRFKLPRTKWGFVGLRDSIGGYVEAGLPNITGQISADANTGNITATGAFNKTSSTASGGVGSGYQYYINKVDFNASRSSSIYGNSTTVQPPATQMYLYFYVGNFEREAVEQTAGLNAEMFNDLNAHKVVDFQAPTEDNSYTWYRKYADGWVEQGGRLTGTKSSGFNTVTLPVEMQDNNYTAFATNISTYVEGTGSSHAYVMAKAGVVNSLATTSLGIFSQNSGEKYSWQVSGMSA